MQHEKRLKELCDSIKHKKMYYRSLRRKIEFILRMISENIPILGEKNPDIQIQRTRRTPIKINKRGPTPKHIVIKFPKYSDKEKNYRKHR